MITSKRTCMSRCLERQATSSRLLLSSYVVGRIEIMYVVVGIEFNSALGRTQRVLSKLIDCSHAYLITQQTEIKYS